jgi:hypothetical protein
MCVQVRIVDQSVQANTRGAVTGVVFFDFGEFQFPESGWNDSIVVVLEWWLSALVELLRGTTTEAELRFMEGPLCVEVEQDLDQRCEIRCIEGRSRRLRYECEGSVCDLLRSILAAAVHVRTICRHHGWHSSDIEALDTKISLARLLAKAH